MLGCDDVNVALTPLLKDTNDGAMLVLDGTSADLVEDPSTSEVTAN